MRTQQEIIERINARKESDFFGFEWIEYVRALEFEAAKAYLKDGVEDWTPDLATDEAIRKCAIDYMEFAWDKAKNCRGISAGRSISHYVAWLWLLGDDELWPTLEDYEFYGKDSLRKMCKFLGLNPDDYDDGIRVNSEDELYAVERNREALAAPPEEQR